MCMSIIPSGHVDAGKSTLMGHLLYKLGHVSKKTMHKYVTMMLICIYVCDYVYYKI